MDSPHDSAQARSFHVLPWRSLRLAGSPPRIPASNVAERGGPGQHAHLEGWGVHFEARQTSIFLKKVVGHRVGHDNALALRGGFPGEEGSFYLSIYLSITFLPLFPFPPPPTIESFEQRTDGNVLTNALQNTRTCSRGWRPRTFTKPIRERSGRRHRCTSCRTSRSGTAGTMPGHVESVAPQEESQDRKKNRK